MRKVLHNASFLTALMVMATSAFFSCSASFAQDEIEFVTDKQSYDAGEGVMLILRNNRSDRLRDDNALGYNLCFSVLEKKVNSAWMNAESKGVHACVDIIYGLRPGESVQYKMSLDSYVLDNKVDQGTYRYCTEIEDSRVRGDDVKIYTNEFSITHGK